MTDTDDTDELLLIPPDFFVVDSDCGHSEGVQPYYNIVDNLIRQVDNIQNRLKLVESCESFHSNSLDYSSESLQIMENGRHNFRRYNSTEDLHTSLSTQNSPQKISTKLKLNSLPNSPNVDRFFKTRNSRHGVHTKLSVNESPPAVFSRKYTKSGRDDQVINEIDTFLSKVKTIQRINAARNLENDFNHFDLKNDQLQNSISSKEKKEPIVKQKTVESGKNRESVIDYESDIKDIVCDQGNIIEKSEIQISNLENSIENNFTQDSLNLNQVSVTDSSSDSTQVTAYNRSRNNKPNLLTNPIHSNALNILNIHKRLLEDSSKKTKTKGSFGDHKQRGRSTIVGDNLGAQLSLMNLADIWNSSNHTLTKSQLVQKLQEEKYRRQHCEDMIQELQTKNLELQQKMSVAVKVDETKNITIKKYQDAVEKLIIRLEKLNKEKIDKEFEINKLKNQHIDEKEDADQKVSRYEKEISKVLNLAHSNQEKTVALEKNCKQLESENQTLSKKLESLELDYLKECDKYKRISEILAQKEIELNENKGSVLAAKTEIIESKQAVDACQSEVNKIKEEYLKSENFLKEEKMQKVELGKKISKLSDEIESYKKRESSLQEELAKCKKQLENSKVDLRNFYQGQVEILVQNKLKEFQCQLDQTENKFKEEVNKREVAIAKSAASHIQQISEKYSLEIKLLEKKHEEESKLYQIQIMQHKQQVEQLRGQLQNFQDKRIAVVKQLQKVMESQWNEALRIISSNKSNTSNDDSSYSAIDQLNSLKMKSHSNLEEVISQNEGEYLEKGKRYDINFKSEREVLNQAAQSIETSKIPTTRALTASEIQKYLSLGFSYAFLLLSQLPRVLKKILLIL